MSRNVKKLHGAAVAAAEAGEGDGEGQVSGAAPTVTCCSHVTVTLLQSGRRQRRQPERVRITVLMW